MRCNRFFYVALALVLILQLDAQTRVWVVDDGPDAAQYSSIQAAVTAAADGDKILIRPGQYGGFTIQGKSLSLIAERPWAVRVSTSYVGGVPIQIRGLAASQSVTLRGLDLYRHSIPSSGTRLGALEILNNSGSVWLEDVRARTTSNGLGVVIKESDSVMFTRCSFPTGVHATNSRTHCYDSELNGRDGSDEYTTIFATYPATGGQPGMEMSGGSLFISGSEFTGGYGGFGTVYGSRSGGAGLLLTGGAQVFQLDSKFACGVRAVNCATSTIPGTTVLSGSVSTVPGVARHFQSNAYALRGGDIGWRFDGQPGDLIFVMLDTRQRPWLHLGHRGTVASPTPLIIPLGSIQGQEPFSFRLTMPPLTAAIHGLDYFLQGIFVDTSPATILSSASSLTAIDVMAYGVDCDRNGENDLWQILAGNAKDANRDGVPDGCQQFPQIYVDDDAPGDPGPGDPTVSDPLENGTPLHPFDSIQEAMAVAAPSTYTIVALERGVYRGVGNRGIPFTSDLITVRGIHGPAATTIDCGGVDQAFTFTGGISARARVEGVRIVNGRGYFGGAVEIRESYPTFVDCLFENNSTTGSRYTSTSGGAIFARDGVPHLIDCRFVGNSTMGRGGALGLHESGVYSRGRTSIEPTIHGCVFENNTASSAGGAIFLQSHSITFVRECEFRGNSASTAGGIKAEGRTVIEDSLFTGNSAISGGAIYCIHSTQLRNCTIVANTANSGGGFAGNVGGNLVATGTVFWGNGPQQILLSAVDGVVNHCLVQGGIGSVYINLGVLEYGTQNLDTNPLFVAPGLGDYRLQAASPCVDAGDPAFSPYLFVHDLAGMDRVVGARVDIGAYEK